MMHLTSKLAFPSVASRVGSQLRGFVGVAVALVGMGFAPLFAQQYTLTVEQHATGIVPGQTTYRFYVNMLNPTDFLSSMYGNNADPLSINTSTGFYNDAFATGSTADGINGNFLPLVPSMGADSWVTIGISQNPVGSQVAVSTVESATQPWLGRFSATSPTSGQNVLINDNTGGAWYVLNGTPNGLPNPTTMRVLCMQITTAGTISGTLNAQVFPLGVGANQQQMTYHFNGVGTFLPAVDPIPGCIDALACNYNANANTDNGSCVYPALGEDCAGNCLADADGDGVCDAAEVVGCTTSTACNFDPLATDDSGNCTFPATGYNCAGACLQDTDGDGICNPFEVVGCQNNTACNFNPLATDAGSCTFPASGYNCAGACLQDTDGDGICNPFEIVGCQNATACNYNAAATDPGSCTFPPTGYNCAGVCLQDTDGDGVCNPFEVAGCSDMAACNYNAFATDPGTCEYALPYYNCAGNCLQDTDGDGVCNPLEVLGCTVQSACNYNPAATDDNASCVFPATGYDCDGDCLVDTDNDGICNPFEIVGCQDQLACNFDPSATDAGSCEYAQAGYDCAGNCLVDTDGDEVCDEFEVSGCTDPTAANYDPDATDDDGSCIACGIEIMSSGSTNIGCFGDDSGSIFVEAMETTGNGGSLTYVLMPGDISNDTGIFEDLEAGSYMVMISDENGCTVDAVFILSQPEELAISVDEVTAWVDGVPGGIEVTISGGTPPYVFEWTGLDGAFTSSDEDLDGLEAGEYVLTVTDANGCDEGTDNILIELINEVANPATDASWGIFPNPASTTVQVVFSQSMDAGASWQVTDGTGRVVASRSGAMDAHTWTLDVSGWESGIYHFHMISNQGRSGRLFVVQH